MADECGECGSWSGQCGCRNNRDLEVKHLYEEIDRLKAENEYLRFRWKNTRRLLADIICEKEEEQCQPSKSLPKP